MGSRDWIIVLIVLAVLVACGLLGADRAGSQQRRRPHAPEEGRPGRATPTSVEEDRVVVNGRTRTFLVHVPSSHTPARPAPLVFVFHGGGGTGRAISGRLGFTTLADRHGFIAVFPDGYKGNWADGRGTTEPELEGIDDIAFVRAMYAELTKRFAIDRTRVYAAGLSNGGIFANRLGCELADMFTGVAFVAGPMAAPVAQRCLAQQPLSILGIFGTDDPIIPWSGGQVRAGDRGPILGVEQTIAFWVKRNGCAELGESETLSAAVEDGTKVTRTVYRSCRQGRGVIFYRIDGGGHAWPPVQTRRQARAGLSSQNLNASQVIWEFFASQPQRDGR